MMDIESSKWESHVGEGDDWNGERTYTDDCDVLDVVFKAGSLVGGVGLRHDVYR